VIEDVEWVWAVVQPFVAAAAAVADAPAARPMHAKSCGPEGSRVASICVRATHVSPPDASLLPLVVHPSYWLPVRGWDRVARRGVAVLLRA
jgi:hypothetical protein